MKYLLFGYHDNRPMNKYFLLIFAHFDLKTTTFLNVHKNYRYNDIILKLSGMIALFILNLKNSFLLGWESPIFRGTGGKIGLKNGRMLQIPGCLGKIFPVPPYNIRTCLVTYFWHITSTFSFRNHQKISKNCIFP